MIYIFNIKSTDLYCFISKNKLHKKSIKSTEYLLFRFSFHKDKKIAK